MESIPDWWQPRHVEALRAWEVGDLERLYELCGSEIRQAAKSAAVREGLAHTVGITGALEEYGQKGVWKAAGRYDPQKGAFQPYARRDIYFETRRGARAWKDAPAAAGRAPLGGNEHAVLLEDALGRLAPGELEALQSRITDEMSADDVEDLKSYMLANETRLTRTIGRDRTAAILAAALSRGVIDHWSAPPPGPPSRWRKVASTGIETSGPLHVRDILRTHRRKHLTGPDISNRRIAKMLAASGIPVSDKTVKAWRDRMEAAGPPPRDLGALHGWLGHINNTPRNRR
jgi:hypothetical protein